ncbi:polymorphic toxin-type HINT domain-containing protein [Streptomyces sp. NPDC002574]|uniref:polymorphic toxin-type HINT domain-containing protein n=1 Tax=Streptomyces sp. NPDC002574 TaxID=3364652 RepID=UPI00367686D8
MLSAALSFSLLAAPAWAQPSDGFSLRSVPKAASVPGKDLTTHRQVKHSPSERDWQPPGRTTWPAAGTADVVLPAGVGGTAHKTARPQRVQAGSLPVRVGLPISRPKGAKAKKHAALVGPGRVHITLADRATTQRAGIQGLLLTVRPTAGAASAVSAADVQVDYSAIESAFGAGWSSRLRLVQLPACALTSPGSAKCAKGVPLATTNDTAAHTLTATVAFPAHGDSGSSSATSRSSVASGTVVLAATAAASGGEGSFKATSLSPAGAWSAGGNSGGFGWNVPMSVPPVPGGLQPKVALSYNSSAVDGRTSSTNNQTSWIGEGWEYSPGYIERSYASCENDKQGGNNTAKVGDLCWKSKNATLSLNGRSTPLVWDASKSTWKLADDDGSRIEQVFGTSPNDVNGDADFEYWKLTALDGTQYWFGKNRLPGWTSGKEETNSLARVAVYGNHTGEPGHGSDFASSAQQQGWRWNLDYVVDPHNNAMALYYTKEAGYYAQNGKTDTPQSYTRGSYLTRIDYGLRADAIFSTTNPAGRVTFGVDERCLSNCGTFDEAHATSWPDVPVDLNCTASSTACLQGSPTFWTRMRLTSINTFALQGSTLQPVDTWTLTQTFPLTGDVSKPALWLDSIQHTGKAGTLTDITLPKTTFGGTPMPNRVDSAEGRPPLNKYRITQVTNETGGQTLVTYSPTDCTPTSLPSSADQNTRRCYPSWWTPDGAVDPVKDWFHKYLVTQVIEDDTTAGTGSASKTTTYEYSNGPNWRRDVSEFTVDKHRTWNVFRGYGTVRTLTGATNRTKTETLYYTGMAGDTLADGSTRPQSLINGVTNRDDFAGRAAEARTYDKDGTGGKVVAKTTFTPWVSGATATQNITGVTDPDKPTTPGPTLPDLVARHSGTETEAAGTLLDDGSWRTLTTSRKFDTTYGLLVAEGDSGDAANGVGPTCTSTDYVTPDTTNWLISYPKQTATVALATCNGGYAHSAITSVARTSYDGQAIGAAPKPRQTTNTTKTEQASKIDANDQVVWDTTNQTTTDQYGRVTVTKGQDLEPTTTSYSPLTGAQPTTVTVTNAETQSSITKFDGLRGLILQTTDPNNNTATSEYDSLGRLSKAWSAGRATTTDPNATFAYNVSASAPSTVTTKTLYEDGTWGTSVEIYDSLLRQRQTQADAIGVTGRTVTDTFYDTLGRAFQTNAPFYNNQAVSTTLLTVTPNQIPVSNLTEYDGRGRPTAAVTLSLNVEKWRTTTTYGDTWTATIPPRVGTAEIGGTATMVITDVRGRTTELRDYKDRNPVPGAAASQYEKTTYAYDRAGRLSAVTDASGHNSWTYTYDLRGRQTATTDPDKGESRTTYDTDGRVATVTSAVGKPGESTLATTYDDLGRKTSLRVDSVTGTKLAEWAYDTAPNGLGLPASATRYDTSVTPAAAYKTEVAGYDTAGQATGTTVTVPSVTGEEKLAGTYTVATTVTPVNGMPATATYSTGNTNATTALPAEKVTNHYGAQDQLAIVDGMSSQAYLRGASYTPFGELAQAELGNVGTRITQTLGYDTVTRRLSTSIVDREASNPQTLSNIKYTYDTVGNVTRIRDDQNDGTIADDQCFAYDWAQRLAEAWTTADACATKPVNGSGTPALGTVDPYWTSWTFTNTGGRATEIQHKAGPVTADTTRTYSYPTASGAAQAHAVTTVTATGGATGSDSYQYDDTGNLTKNTPATGAVQDLTWNEEGKLATSTISGDTTKFLYDADGTRILKREPTTTTLYLPGGQELVLTKTAGTLAGTRYYTVPGGSAIRTSSDAKVRFLIADPHGTNTLSVSAATLAVDRRKTLPYGSPRGTTPTSWPGQKGFVGGDIDTTTGYTHIGARDYDPTIGRFISIDPILNTGEQQSLNGYAYANNSPVTQSDPTGLDPCGGLTCGHAGDKCSDIKIYCNAAKPDGTADSSGVVPDSGGTATNDSHGNTSSGNDTTNCSNYGYMVGSACTVAVSKDEDVVQSVSVETTTHDWIDDALPCEQGDWLCRIRKASLRTAIISGMLGGSTGLLSLSGGRGPCSFDQGTLVLLEHGKTKHIKDVKPGDHVEAGDPETGKHDGPHTVTAAFSHHDNDLIDLTIRGQDGKNATLHTTSEHPFWDETKHAWIPAGKLKAGHELNTDQNRHVVLVAVHVRPGSAYMYNLTVADLHTYYVLAGYTPVLVHNTCLKTELTQLGRARIGEVKSGLSEGDRLPGAFSVGRDRTTGKTYYGESGPDTGHHPDVTSRLPAQSQHVDNRPPGVCAEARMCTNALNDGAALENLDIITLNPRGDKFKMCPNCRVWVPGAVGEVLTG